MAGQYVFKSKCDILSYIVRHIVALDKSKSNKIECQGKSFGGCGLFKKVYFFLMAAALSVAVIFAFIGEMEAVIWVLIVTGIIQLAGRVR